MKRQLILALVAGLTALGLPACTTVEDDDDGPAVHSTTTTETTRVRPVSSSVEQTTVRSY